MTTWRARHFRLQITKRRAFHVTLRRFRRSRPTNSHHVVNVRIASIRQIVWQLRVKRRRARRAARARGNQKLQQIRTALPIGLVMLGLVGAGYSIYQLVHTRSLEPQHTFATTADIKEQAATSPLTLPRSMPTHITIRSQNIDVDIIPVDRDSNGAIAMPPTLDWVAGWYDLSPTPGELGPSVIVGHVDTYEGISVFWNLRYVLPGDSVAITRTDGNTANFTVTALQEYDQANFPTATVYGNTSDAELRIITCGGEFDTATGHYTQNTVVYAKLIGKV
jgi:hypothetical protein